MYFRYLVVLLVFVLMSAGCISPQGQAVNLTEIPALPTYDGETISQHFSWDYGGTTHTLTISTPKGLYEYYRCQDHAKGSSYVRYALSEYDREYVKKIADAFGADGKKSGYTRQETIENFVAFVQSLPYTSDILTTGIQEYPRYPVETIVDHGGDCEDRAILTAAVLYEMGHGTVLLELPDHMAVGIAGEPQMRGTRYLYDGVLYYYLETTAGGWKIGVLPDEFSGKPVKILPMTQQPVLEFWFEVTPVSVGFEETAYEIVGSVKNFGPGTARGVTLEVTATAGGVVVDRQTIAVDDCGENGSVQINGSLTLPRKTTVLVTAVLSGGNAYKSLTADSGLMQIP